MLSIKFRICSAGYALAYGFIILCAFQEASTSEITELSRLLDDSLGFEISLPVLMCHVKYTGYTEVRWYKDYKLVRKGSTNLTDHILSVASLRNSSSFQFEHPLKLQGYYWCETDYAGPTTVLNYLFRIAEIHTFVGRFLSTQDSLDSNDSKLILKEKLAIKKRIYEVEIANELFDFLPKPNTHVTDIKILQNGLEIRFYLYSRPLFNPRRPFASKLQEDQYELDHIVEYLNNDTVAVHPDIYQQITDWTTFRGIHIKDIILRSTLGCYQDLSLVPAEPPREVTWPFAKIGEVVIPIESCSSKNGLAVTRLCTGSFYTGAKWGSPSGICNLPAKKLTVQLRDLHNRFGDDPKPVYIQKLLELTRNSSLLTVTDLHIVADILTELSEVKELKPNEIDGVFSVFDDLVETNTSELQAAKSTIKLTSRLLRVIDNILRLASLDNKEFLISKKHFLVDAKDSKVIGKVEDHIHGIAILPSDKNTGLVNASVEFLTSKMTVPQHNSLAYFLLPTELVIRRENETRLPFKCQVNVVFCKDWLLFQSPKGILERRHYKVLPTPVMYVSVSGGPAWNLTQPVHLFFKDKFQRKIENPVCVHYDPRLEGGEGAWSTEGCEYGGLHNGFFECRCHHLSIFAVILSERPDATSKTFHLGTAIYVGCGVSIIALSMTVIMYLLSKIWRSTVDHSVLFWMALSFLCCLILLFISEMHFLWKPGCLLMAMLLHYTILVTLGWLLVQAVMHKLRFSKKTDMDEVPHFILKSALSTWGVPILIMIIIWLTRDFKYYKNENCWRTVADVSNVALIPIVTVLLITLCVNMCAMYAVTCRFKKDFLIGNSIYNDSVIKFRVANSIYLFYVLSWLFGFLALHYKSKELRILFSICITLTSYYLALFFIFHEFSLWEMCRKWRRTDKEETEAVEFVAKDKKAEIIHPESSK